MFYIQVIHSLQQDPRQEVFLGLWISQIWLRRTNRWRGDIGVQRQLYKIHCKAPVIYLYKLLLFVKRCLIIVRIADCFCQYKYLLLKICGDSFQIARELKIVSKVSVVH